MRLRLTFECAPRLHLIVLIALAVFPIYGQNDNEWLIAPPEKVGKIDLKNAGLAAVVAAYGPANVTQVEIPGDEGSVEIATVLFAKSPEKRLEILWKDPESKAQAARFKWRGDRSLWHSASGIRLGTPLKELEGRNERPLKLTGFDWDYPGTITSCSKGKLEPELFPKGGRLIVRLDKGNPITKKEAGSIAGDKIFLSSNPVFQKKNPRVFEMILDLEAP